MFVLLQDDKDVKGARAAAADAAEHFKSAGADKGAELAAVESLIAEAERSVARGESIQ